MSSAPPPGWGPPQHGTPPVPAAPPAHPQPGPAQPAPAQPGPAQPAWEVAPPAGPAGAPPPSSGNRVALIVGLVVIGLVLVGVVGAVFLLPGDDEVASSDDVVSDLEGTVEDLTTRPASPLPDASAAPGAPALPATTASPTAGPPSPAAEVPAPAPQDPNAADQSVFELAPGVCFNDPSGVDQIQSVAVVDCASPHDNEVYALVPHPAGPTEPFPGREALVDFATAECQGDRYTEYVGVEYSFSAYFESHFTPTEGSWAQGDREIVCLLYDPTAPLTGSVRGTGQ